MSHLRKFSLQIQAYLLHNTSPPTLLSFLLNKVTPHLPVNNATVVASPSGWFTLDGRRLADKPTLRGIYLHNGKKVIVP
jgi:hypothetical protein